MPTADTGSRKGVGYRLGHGLGRQLAHPHGWAGRAVGWMMGLANHRPNRVVINALELEPHHVLLDAGCGAGQALKLALRQCAKATGFDASPLMVAQAQARNRRDVTMGRLSLFGANFGKIPCADNRFDRIMASNVAYFWDDFGVILCELDRVLKPGGRIVIYVTEAGSMQSWRFAQTGTHRLFDRQTLLEELLSAVGERMTVTVDKVGISRHITGLVAVLDKRI